VWLQRVKEGLGEELKVNWKYFSLEQVNSQQGPEWKLWEQPEDYASRGRNAFCAAEAARKQGEAAFDDFHHALLKARHEEKRDIADTATLIEVAEGVGLDVRRFREDLADRRLLVKLGEDHTFAAEILGVFGTPTLVFPEQQAVFVKMMPPPSAEEAGSVFAEVRQIAEGRREIREIKRPQAPAKG